VNLAISLHAPNDALRGELAPISRACPLADLFAAIRDYLTATGRRVSFEYVLLDGRNDRSEQAEELARLLRAQLPAGEAPRVHVNLIAWNSVPGTDLSRSRRERVRAFQRALETRGVPCTVRVERGTRIGAACGQLAGA
jgi:23S rRNA (adenine2503-C2)-methyltransferase